MVSFNSLRTIFSSTDEPGSPLTSDEISSILSGVISTPAASIIISPTFIPCRCAEYPSITSTTVILSPLTPIEIPMPPYLPFVIRSISSFLFSSTKIV